jgi:ribonucleotide monophosphatase NagD (HAD superfamily)
VCDQTGVLTILYSSQHYPATLRRVVVKDDTGKRITFLTNNSTLTNIRNLSLNSSLFSEKR